MNGKWLNVVGSVARYQPNVSNFSLPVTMHQSLFTIHDSLFTNHDLPFTNYHSPSHASVAPVGRCMSFFVRSVLMTVCIANRMLGFRFNNLLSSGLAHER